MATDYFPNKTVKKLLNSYQDVWALSHLAKLAMWDGEVYMPVKGANYRGFALAKVQTLTKKFLTDKNFQLLLKQAEAESLNEYERAIVRVLNRELFFYEKLPVEFLEEFEKTVSNAQLVWREARQTNNYELFQPYLEKIIELSRQKADYLGYQNHAYDALLDTFEEGSTVSALDDYFTEVVDVVSKLLTKIKASAKYPFTSEISDLKYKQSTAETLNNKLLEFLHYDSKRLRLDISSHPFSEGLSTDDSRITTRYEGKDIVKTVTSTIHEFGHALYFLQHDPKFNTTPLYTNYSLALHESQSRFFENHIGRSQKFLQENLSLFQALGEDYTKYNAAVYYRYFNQVNPSLIRVEADEVTYHLHIYIRYQLEKQLLSGELSVADIPSRWNELYTKFLGVTPPDDAQGCLQDIHWSMGAIGYFPTYSQGTVFAAQIANELELKIGSLNTLIAQEDGVKTIKNWLKQNIHTHGSVYTFLQLSEKLTGKSFQTQSWAKYLQQKYAKLYQI